MSETIEQRVRQWESEALPAFPRRRALLRLLPSSGLVAAVVVGAVGQISGQRWLLVLALVVMAYHLFHMYAEAAWGVHCQVEDHWVGDGEIPEGVTRTCPYCREIPLRELWRAR